MGPPLSSSSGSWVAPPKHRFRLKLRAAIAASLLFVTVSLAVAMTVINQRGSAAALRAATGALMQSSVDLVAAQTEALLEQVAARVEVSADVLGQGPERQPSGVGDVEMLLFSLVESGHDLHYAQFGTVDGSFVLVRRNADGGLDTKFILQGRSTWKYRDPGQALAETRTEAEEPDDDYDPRRRPWYRGAMKTDGLFWTRAYAHAATGESVVTAAHAVRTAEGRAVGVVSATLALSYLNQYLRRLSSSKTLVFIADERDQLIAISNGQLRIDRSDPTALRLPKIADVALPQVAAFGDSPLLRESRKDGQPPALHRMLVEDDAYLAVVRALTPMAGRHWSVGAVVAEASVLSEVRRSLATSAVVAIVVITVFVVLGIALARTLAGPLLAIAGETRRIQRLELEDRHMAASRFEEIAEIQEAYAHLKVGLRAFEKYVPVDLVRTLLAEHVDPEPGGQEQELTLFFSDIRGFTSFAHSVSTKELAEVLSLYLQTIVDEIERSGGTVDKFVGDGVMAFWNAPRLVDSHPIEAVRASIRCRDGIRAMSRAQQLFTRIGVHTGRAFVGNFGSTSRFSYTALGDAVNLASRLEGANKRFGTEIIISAATEGRLDDSIIRRHLDRITVLGRQEGIDVYEVIGFKGEVDAATVARARRYEAGLEAYFRRRFTEAEAELCDLAHLDQAAALLIERCRRYAAAPPREDWDGVFGLSEK